MSVKSEELTMIITKFADSGWDLIDEPSRAWLEGRMSSEELLPILMEADLEFGSCGCEFDSLYKIAITELLQITSAE